MPLATRALQAILNFKDSQFLKGYLTSLYALGLQFDGRHSVAAIKSKQDDIVLFLREKQVLPFKRSDGRLTHDEWIKFQTLSNKWVLPDPPRSYTAKKRSEREACKAVIQYHQQPNFLSGFLQGLYKDDVKLSDLLVRHLVHYDQQDILYRLHEGRSDCYQAVHKQLTVAIQHTPSAQFYYARAVNEICQGDYKLACQDAAQAKKLETSEKFSEKKAGIYAFLESLAAIERIPTVSQRDLKTRSDLKDEAAKLNSLALQKIEKAIAENKEDGVCYLVKGICLEKENKTHDALECFKNVLGINKFQAQAYFHLSDCQAKRAQDEGRNYCYTYALDYWIKFKSLDKRPQRHPPVNLTRMRLEIGDVGFTRTLKQYSSLVSLSLDWFGEEVPSSLFSLFKINQLRDFKFRTWELEILEKVLSAALNAKELRRLSAHYFRGHLDLARLRHTPFWNQPLNCVDFEIGGIFFSDSDSPVFFRWLSQSHLKSLALDNCEFTNLDSLVHFLWTNTFLSHFQIANLVNMHTDYILILLSALKNNKNTRSLKLDLEHKGIDEAKIIKVLAENRSLLKFDVTVARNPLDLKAIEARNVQIVQIEMLMTTALAFLRANYTNQLASSIMILLADIVKFADEPLTADEKTKNIKKKLNAFVHCSLFARSVVTTSPNSSLRPPAARL